MQRQIIISYNNYWLKYVNDWTSAKSLIRIDHTHKLLFINYKLR